LRAGESEIHWRSLAPIVLASVCHGGWIASNVTRQRTASDSGPPVQNDVARCGRRLPWSGRDCRPESGRRGDL